MGVITTGHFSKLLWPGINAVYGSTYREHTPEYSDIYSFNRSDKAYEEDVGTTGFGLAPVKTQGAGISYDSQEQGYVHRYTNVTYGLGFIITRELYEDKQYALPMINRASALAFSMRQTKETVGANILNRAFAPAYAGPDGVELCSLLHPNISGGTWANELATAADLSEVSLEQACIDIGNFTNDRGLKINVMPECLILPVNLEFEAFRLLKSILQAGTANNAINAIRAMNKFPKGVKINHYLTDTDAWFIKTNCPNGMKYFERRADDFQNDSDFDTENAKYKATGRYAFGVTDRRGLFGSPGI